MILSHFLLVSVVATEKSAVSLINIFFSYCFLLALSGAFAVYNNVFRCWFVSISHVWNLPCFFNISLLFSLSGEIMYPDHFILYTSLLVSLSHCPYLFLLEFSETYLYLPTLYFSLFSWSIVFLVLITTFFIYWSLFGCCSNLPLILFYDFFLFIFLNVLIIFILQTLCSF